MGQYESAMVSAGSLITTKPVIVVQEYFVGRKYLRKKKLINKQKNALISEINSFADERVVNSYRRSRRLREIRSATRTLGVSNTFKIFKLFFKSSFEHFQIRVVLA